ncbi:hypothetical protein KIH39_11755 [Telmatocola sphagniphila]|uniref:Uncharacterized protein n=1 Tax=Telmatocola sphagniphila TaxID=1123043 RepID=A0A8E6BAW1_9BACT|nr:hypothetical protein [Telmatocola sphagniphila]QVL34547.1 hypothetical protein KIH39_11755 [Telmatocola sphagniphila]
MTEFSHDTKSTGFSRRKVLLTAGALAAGTLSASAEVMAGEDQKKVEKKFEGESREGKIQEALDNALKELDKAMGEGGVADGLANWKLSSVSGQRGGFAGRRGVKVEITATRSPDWQEKR